LHERTALRRRLKMNGFFSESIGVFLPGYAESLYAIAKQDHAEIFCVMLLIRKWDGELDAILY
jgi:hypothetical protein